nr:DUF2163 domain-containing protein [Ancylobacter lacus]
MPPAFAAGLATGATTLARCWRLTRTDGVVLGLTEHDEDLTVDGTLFRAAGGVAGTESRAALGFAVDGSELSAALSADALSEADLAAGRVDGAEAELLLVDWSNPASFVRLRRGSIGEVRREDGVFAAELRSQADRLNETRGRRFTAGCDADLGDARCGVDLAAPGRTGFGRVVQPDGEGGFRATGLEGFASGVFTQGRLVFTGGACAGFATEVKVHRLDAGVARLELWQRPPEPLAAEDAFRVTAGCDKSFATCRDRFGNSVNFRGFPHMPGNDRVLKVARAGG